MIQTLVPQLRVRFGESAANCGASSSEVESCKGVKNETLIDMLEEARVEYSTFNPSDRILTFTMNSTNPVIELDEEPYAVTAVYVSGNRDHQELEFPANFYNIRPYFQGTEVYDPALARVDQMFSDYGNPAASFIRTGKQIRITSPISYLSRVEVHISGMRGWDEMPVWATPILLKMGLIKLIDHATTSNGSLLRIPTPSGYFEWDGGRVMQNLRTKLSDEVFRTMQNRTGGLSQG